MLDSVCLSPLIYLWITKDINIVALYFYRCFIALFLLRVHRLLQTRLSEWWIFAVSSLAVFVSIGIIVLRGINWLAPFVQHLYAAIISFGPVLLSKLAFWFALSIAVETSFIFLLLAFLRFQNAATPLLLWLVFSPVIAFLLGVSALVILAELDLIIKRHLSLSTTFLHTCLLELQIFVIIWIHILLSLIASNWGFHAIEDLLWLFLIFKLLFWLLVILVVHFISLVSACWSLVWRRLLEAFACLSILIFFSAGQWVNWACVPVLSWRLVAFRWLGTQRTCPIVLRPVARMRRLLSVLFTWVFDYALRVFPGHALELFPWAVLLAVGLHLAQARNQSLTKCLIYHPRIGHVPSDHCMLMR